MANEDYLINRVRQLVRSVSGTHSSDAEVVEYIKSAIRRTIGSIPKELLWMFASSGTDITDGNGQSLSFADTIISVLRNGVFCDPINERFAYGLGSSSSLYQATAQFPKYYLKGNSVYIKPDPAAGAVGSVISVAMPSITSTSTSALGVLDALVVELAAYYDCQSFADYIRDLANTELAKVDTDISSFVTAIPTYSAPSDPTMPSLTLVTMGSLPTLSMSDASYSFPSLSVSFIKPTLSLSSMTALPSEGISAITISSPGTLTLPSVPTLPALNEVPMGSLPSDISSGNIVENQLTSQAFSNVTSVTVTHNLGYYPLIQILDGSGNVIDGEITHSSVNEAVITFATAQSGTIIYQADFSGIDSPAYSAPTAPSIGTLSITDKTIGSSDSITLPSAISLPPLSLPDAPAFTDLDLSGISVPSKILSYTSAGTAPNGTMSLSESFPTFTQPVFNIDDTVIDDALTKAQKLIDDGANVGGDTIADTDSFQGRLASDDTELGRVVVEGAQSEIQRARTAIDRQNLSVSKYREEIAEEIRRFDGEIGKYKEEVNKELSRIRAENESYNSQLKDNQNDLEEQIRQYQLDIDKYQNQVKATVEEWTNEEVNFKLTKWVNQAKNTLAEYNEKANALINNYRVGATAEIERFRNESADRIQEFDAEMKADIEEWVQNADKLLRKYQDDIGEAVQSYGNGVSKYRADVEKMIGTFKAESDADVRVYQSNFEKILREYELKNQSAINLWNTEQSAILAKYRENVQAVVQEFSANADYRIKEAGFNLNREVEEYKEQVTAFINEYQVKTNAEINEYRVLLDAETQRVTAEINEFQTKAQAWAQEVQTLRQSEIQEYQEKVRTAIESYTAQNTAKINEYSGKAQAEVTEYQALVQSAVQDFTGNINIARSYIESAVARAQAATGYVQNFGASLSHADRLYKSYVEGIEMFIKNNSTMMQQSMLAAAAGQKA